MLLLMLLACAGDAEAPLATDTGGPCDEVLSSRGLWWVTLDVVETTCGVAPGEPQDTYYGLTHTGLGFALGSCEGLDAAGVIAGCQWTYRVEEMPGRAGLPEGGTWSLEAAGYAWDEPVDYCSLPEGLDWETEEVMTLDDPGTTGLEAGCTWTIAVTGTVW